MKEQAVATYEWFSWRIRHTVFRPIESGTQVSQVLATLFHRTAVTLYGIYFAWGCVSLFAGIPSLRMEAGIEFQLLFSALIALLAPLAAAGALWFPKHGRMELFFGAALATSIAIYLAFQAQAAFSGDFGRLANFVLNLAHIVVPTARAVFVYKTLVRRANGDTGGD